MLDNITWRLIAIKRFVIERTVGRRIAGGSIVPMPRSPARSSLDHIRKE